MGVRGGVRAAAIGIATALLGCAGSGGSPPLEPIASSMGSDHALFDAVDEAALPDVAGRRWIIEFRTTRDGRRICGDGFALGDPPHVVIVGDDLQTRWGAALVERVPTWLRAEAHGEGETLPGLERRTARATVLGAPDESVAPQRIELDFVAEIDAELRGAAPAWKRVGCANVDRLQPFQTIVRARWALAFGRPDLAAALLERLPASDRDPDRFREAIAAALLSDAEHAFASFMPRAAVDDRLARVEAIAPGTAPARTAAALRRRLGEDPAPNGEGLAESVSLLADAHCLYENPTLDELVQQTAWHEVSGLQLRRPNHELVHGGREAVALLVPLLEDPRLTRSRAGRQADGVAFATIGDTARRTIEQIAGRKLADGPTARAWWTRNCARPEADVWLEDLGSVDAEDARVLTRRLIFRRGIRDLDAFDQRLAIGSPEERREYLDTVIDAVLGDDERRAIDRTTAAALGPWLGRLARGDADAEIRDRSTATLVTIDPEGWVPTLVAGLERGEARWVDIAVESLDARRDWSAIGPATRRRLARALLERAAVHATPGQWEGSDVFALAVQLLASPILPAEDDEIERPPTSRMQELRRALQVFQEQRIRVSIDSATMRVPGPVVGHDVVARVVAVDRSPIWQDTVASHVALAPGERWSSSDVARSLLAVAQAVATEPVMMTVEHHGDRGISIWVERGCFIGLDEGSALVDVGSSTLVLALTDLREDLDARATDSDLRLCARAGRHAGT